MTTNKEHKVVCAECEKVLPVSEANLTAKAQSCGCCADFAYLCDACFNGETGK